MTKIKLPKVHHRIFTPFLLTHLTASRIFKKSKWDNFVGGLIFGALFSLFVNVVTIQIQELIQKQRVLEALEQEIVFHAINANGIVQEAGDKAERREFPNYFHRSKEYSNRVWSTAEALKYIVQLDPEVQGQLATYYSTIIEGTNQALEKNNQLAEEHLTGCYFQEGLLSKEAESECRVWYYQTLKNEVNAAELVSNHTFELLDKFHPTQDRLRSPILRLFMGGKAIRILSGD